MVNGDAVFGWSAKTTLIVETSYVDFGDTCRGFLCRVPNVWLERGREFDWERVEVDSTESLDFVGFDVSGV